MKRLTILRHAKAAPEPAQKDFDRPLTKRGREAAAAMGGFMQNNLPPVDGVLCSPAARTRKTLDCASARFENSFEVRYPDKLYLASPAEIIAFLKAADDLNHILLIGHNPGLHMLALELADPSPSDMTEMKRLAAKFPTAALAHLHFPYSDWAQLSERSGALIAFRTPKDLRRGRLPE